MRNGWPIGAIQPFIVMWRTVSTRGIGRAMANMSESFLLVNKYGQVEKMGRNAPPILASRSDRRVGLDGGRNAVTDALQHQVGIIAFGP